MSRPPITRKSGKLFDRQLIATLDYLEANIGPGGGATSWGSIPGKPSTFPPEAHTQAISTVTGLQTALDGKQAAGSYAAATHTHAQGDVTGLTAALAAKQDALVSATNIKTINGASVLGSGDLTVTGGATKGTATVTVPQNRTEWSETVTATGVTGASFVVLSIAPHTDSDENDVEMLDVLAMSAAPGTDQITVAMAFASPTRGAIKLNWMAA